MHLNKLSVQGYKSFNDLFEVTFAQGVNVLVGENASGKTAIIDALRLLLRESEFGNTPVSDTDFHRPFGGSKTAVDSFCLKANFTELSKTEHVAFLPWSDLDGNASLTLQVDNRPSHRKPYKRTVWGGASKASMFEWDIFDTINCVYLPPLRDAEAKLREGKGSRLARLLKNLQREKIQEAKDSGKDHPLEKKVRDFNQGLVDDKDGAIAKANDIIRNRLEDALGTVFGQDVHLQFSEVSFNRIVESLRLLFFPNISKGTKPEEFRSLEENSLGYNNLLYLATVLAELTESPEPSEYLRVLLIEEPEAHLHPQLQIRLLKYLEKTAKEKKVQIIVTTHSPVLAASVSLNTIIHLSAAGKKPEAVPLRSCGLPSEPKNNSLAFVNRWLDVTKSTLLFARGVILVEGISEAMILPELAQTILKAYNEKVPKEKSQADLSTIKPLPKSLEDAGVSIINMNGIYFKHFMWLFADLNGGDSKSIPVRCAGITDKDPEKGSKPTNPDHNEGNNPALALIDMIKSSKWARLYAGPLKTFEYDLAMEANNLGKMASLLAENWPTDGDVKDEITKLSEVSSSENDTQKAVAAFDLLERIEDDNMGKGAFAQLLADAIKEGVEITTPEYIRKAVIWACGGNLDDA